MNIRIRQQLVAIAQEKGVRIWYACESGSRGWGFPSPDSDYDVRFIYTWPEEHYLSISEPVAQFGFPISDELDVYGWDLRKTLQLIQRSNTTPFEWLQSPVIYHEQPGFRDALWSLCQDYFSRRSNTHHYLGIAKGAKDTMTTEGQITIKKLFYILRPLLAAQWCLERGTISPMSFAPLMDLLPADIRVKVTTLINQKAGAAEGFKINPDPALIDWINQTEEALVSASTGLERNLFSAESLNIFFRTIIQLP